MGNGEWRIGNLEKNGSRRLSVVNSLKINYTIFAMQEF